MKAPLRGRVEYAILEIVMQMNGQHQDKWVRWHHLVSVRCGEKWLDPGELKDAMTGLHAEGIVTLTKPDGLQRDAFRYSVDLGEDEQYFFRGQFNVDITSKGRSYWAAIETGRVGF
jgi:hypothetical protein